MEVERSEGELKIEVIYESIPYTLEGSLVKFHNNNRTLCAKELEVNEYGDIYKLVSEDGYSNHIIHTRILDENEKSMFNNDDIAERINKIFKDKGLIELVNNIKTTTNYKSKEKLNLTIKSWGDTK